MNKRQPYKRRRYLINRKFQLEFSIRFLAIVAVAASALLALFFYNFRGTLTAGYTGSEVKLLHTGEYFVSSMLLPTIAIILLAFLISIIVLVLLSHRLAGPLFRFQKSMGQIGGGDLTMRLILRDNDQFKDLADRINAMTETMDGKSGDIKLQAAELTRLVAEMQTQADKNPALMSEIRPALQEMTRRLVLLKDAVGYFKTTSPE